MVNGEGNVEAGVTLKIISSAESKIFICLRHKMACLFCAH